MASKGLSGRRVLSERLRGMRFMKQKEEREHRERLEREQRGREEGMYWTLEGAEGKEDEEELLGPIVIDEGGMGDNTFLGRRGRRTFGNMNEDEGGEDGEIMEDVKEKSGERRKERKARQEDTRREKDMLFGGLQGGVKKRDNLGLNFTKGGRKQEERRDERRAGYK
eukprot:GFKZ01009799.1.p1 GENE.GFKZ01009799.1~~GFKZ01009799.1.p1  ORF type:complete len:167 (-),score=45.34 GFKZ01009799.1:406-906(-)